MVTDRELSISIVLAVNKTNIPLNNREDTEMSKSINKGRDKSRAKDNVYLKQVPIEKIYEIIFGDALERYNSKQTRNDRKIDDYYEHINSSEKSHAQREMIVQVGSVDDIDDGNMTFSEARDLLAKWYVGFQERNPNLIIYNAVIHMDESTPHLHLNFVPVGRKYHRGMDKQVAFDRAIAQQGGIKDTSRPFPEWRIGELAVMEVIMASRGIGRKEVGTHMSMSVDRYKEVRSREKWVEEEELRLDRKRAMLSEREKVIQEKEMELFGE